MAGLSGMNSSWWVPPEQQQQAPQHPRQQFQRSILDYIPRAWQQQSNSGPFSSPQQQQTIEQFIMDLLARQAPPQGGDSSWNPDLGSGSA